MEIIPAIMPEDFYHIEDDVKAVAGHAVTVQLDIMDGKFVHAKTWPYFHKVVDGVPQDIYFQKIQKEEAGLPGWEKVDYELDLMIERPEKNINQWMALGPKRIVLHVESMLDPEKSLIEFSALRSIVEIGLSFDDEYPVAELDRYIDMVDFVQVMGIDEIGKQGEPFEPRSLENIKYIHSKFPEMIISVDGSVNVNTIQDFKNAGATRFVAGSAVFDGVPSENIKKLKKLVS